jgi:hypothetical protein
MLSPGRWDFTARPAYGRERCGRSLSQATRPIAATTHSQGEKRRCRAKPSTATATMAMRTMAMIQSMSIGLRSHERAAGLGMCRSVQFQGCRPRQAASIRMNPGSSLVPPGRHQGQGIRDKASGPQRSGRLASQRMRTPRLPAVADSQPHRQKTPVLPSDAWHAIPARSARRAEIDRVRCHCQIAGIRATGHG